MSGELLLALAAAGRQASLAMFGHEGHDLASAAAGRAARELIRDFLLRELSGEAPLRPESSYDDAVLRLLHTPAARQPVPGGLDGTALSR
jgi:hypothetical protein